MNPPHCDLDDQPKPLETDRSALNGVVAAFGMPALFWRQDGQSVATPAAPRTTRDQVADHAAPSIFVLSGMIVSPWNAACARLN